MTYFLCDTENICRRWSRAVAAAQPGDMFVLFYSKSVGPVSLQLFGPACLKGIRFNFVECDNGRANALDFQLVTELGRLAALDPGARFVILSGDTGFDSVLGFWGRRGVDVRRTDPSQLPDKPEPAPEPAEQPEQPPTLNPCEPDNPEDNGGQESTTSVRKVYIEMLRDAGITGDDARVTAGILIAAMRESRQRRKNSCRNRIRTRWGAEAGEIRYRAIKALVHQIAENGPFPPPEHAGEQPEEQAKPVKPKRKITKAAVKKELDAVGVVLSDSRIGSLANIIRHANNAKKDRKSVLKKQIENAFKTDTDRINLAASQFLLPQ